MKDLERSGDWKQIALLVGGLTAVRLITAGSFPLFAVEAYYWLWGKYPAAGYFDHPPMVAWMSALFFGWVNGSELTARSGPIVLGALTSLAVYGFARALYPSGRAAWRIAALCAVTPMFALDSLLIQPDNSLMLFTVLTWWLFWRAAQEKARLVLWIAVGIAAGLALLSKFHAWVLLPPLWAFLMLSRTHRPLLKTVGPWLAAAVALLVLSPNLYWNARHDWLNYAFQWRRSHLAVSQFDIRNVLHFLLTPALLVSPLIYPAMLWGVWKGFLRWRAKGDARALYLLCAGLPLPVFLGLLTPMVEISVHWPAAGYTALLLLAVGLFEQGDLFGKLYWKWSAVVCVALTAVLHTVPFVVLHLPAIRYRSGRELISTARLKREIVGLREIGDKARAMEDEMSARKPAVIMAENWHLASTLAFYSGRPRDVFVLRSGLSHNFEIWRRERGGLEGVDAVTVIKKSNYDKQHPSYETKYDKYHRLLDPLFGRVEEAPSLIVYEDGAIEDYLGYDVSRPRLREFLIFKCYGFKGILKED